MINWYHLAANALWIAASGLALATLSYARWMATAKHQKLGVILGLGNYQLILNIAGVLFGVGLAGTSGTWWEVTLWLIIAVVFAWQVINRIIEWKS
jgi:hypothetical protein